MLFLIPNSVLLNGLFVTTILQWKREEGKKSGKKTEPQVLPLKRTDQKKQNQEKEAKKAEEMRKRSLETFKDSAKRNADEQQGARPKKSRASGANTLAYLKDRAEVEATLKRDELEIKRQELALQAKEQEGRQQQFDMMNKQTRDIQQLQQQQMQQFMQMNANMMQQHQQQTLALMELMKKFANK